MTWHQDENWKCKRSENLRRKMRATFPARIFLPNTDIYETEEALIVAMEMPGVEKDHTDLTVEDGVLSVSGRIESSTYEELQPIYTEYNIGYYQRSFGLSPNSIDEHKITADMKDGVLTLRFRRLRGSSLGRLNSSECGMATSRLTRKWPLKHCVGLNQGAAI